MESKFVWKAKAVFQNAAAKAERVLTEIKADIVAELSSHSQGGDGSGEFPWVGRTEDEKRVEDELRKRILDISKTSEFLDSRHDGKIEVDMQSAMTVLECDDNLKQLRFHYVPKLMKEKEFWKRYFAAVKRVKADVLATTRRSSGTSENVINRDASVESPRKDPIEEEAYKKAMTVVTIPPSMVVRRLALALESSRSFETMSSLAAAASAAAGTTDKESSQGSEWSSLVSGLKKFSIRDKDKKSGRQTGRYHSLLWSLFDADGQYGDNFKELSKPRLPEELHGAPPQSFIAQLAEIMGGLKTEQKMAEFWLEVVKECRQRFENGLPVPGMPVDSNPDLNYCWLFQQLQVVNCCIARRKRRLAALDTLQDNQVAAANSEGQAPSSHFARLKDGQVVPRICVDRRAENLNMLETGEPVYAPITQEGPVLTEASIKENEELVLRTGSFGAGCSQLFSDMQAFKAANPGCILEDFVRWYSPLDWIEGSGLSTDTDDKDSSLRGCLSTRMKCEGNLWQELWFSARPIPAVLQSPLFDEELAGESTLEELENVAPSDFFEQLFTTALCAGFAIAEASSLASKDPLKRCLKECRDYLLSTCHRHMDSVTLQNLCEVYELMEIAIHAPPEELYEPKPEEKTDTKLLESKTLTNHLADIRKFLQKKRSMDDVQQQQPEQVEQQREGPVSSVVKFFEGKTSFFERKSKQQQQQQNLQQQSPQLEEKKLCSSDSGDWTMV